MVDPSGLSSDIGHDRRPRKKDRRTPRTRMWIDWRSVDCTRVALWQTMPRDVAQVLPVRRDEEHGTHNPLELFLDYSRQLFEYRGQLNRLSNHRQDRRLPFKQTDQH